MNSILKLIEERRAHAVKLVKAAGQEVIDRAEDIIGSGDGLIDFTITLSFGAETCPTLEVTRVHASKRCIDVISEEGKR